MKQTQLIAKPGMQAITVVREFDAPRDLVFKVMNDPALIPQWWGPREYTTRVEKMELRPGGQWRFIQRDSAGEEFAFRGVYHEISAPERVVQTFEFEGIPGHVLLQTTTFEEHNGKTLMNSNLVYQSVEDRDGMLQTGMERGQSESYERLEELLVKA